MTDTDNDTDAIIPVQLVGGPDDWHGSTLDIYRASELTPQAQHEDALGTMLISSHTPLRDETTEDVDPRAHYSPDPPPAPVAVWFFRGWWPASLYADEFPRPANGYLPARVDTDHRGVPTHWHTTHHHGQDVARVWAHWVDTSSPLHTGIWHVATADGDWWELLHTPGGDVPWAAAALPDAPDRPAPTPATRPESPIL